MPGFAETPPATTKPKASFAILDYAVLGNSVLSEEEIGTALEPYLGEAKSCEDIEAARGALSAAYTARGYQSVAVDAKCEVEDGVVRLAVAELPIARLRVVGAKYTTIDEIKAEAPSLAEGKVPNFKDVASDLKALNQEHRSVTPVVEPGREPGTLAVDLKVEDEFPVTASVELNNRYSVGTQRLRLSGAFSYDNLFQEGQSIAVNYLTAPEDTSDTQVFGGSYTAPIGNGDFSLQVSGLHSSSNVAAISSVDVLGRGYQVGFRTIWRAPAVENYASTLTFGFDYKSFDENVLTESVASPAPVNYVPLSVVYLGSYQEDDAVTHGTFTLVHNLRPLSSDGPIGGEVTKFDNKRADARANFTYFRVSFDREQKLFGDWGVRLGLDAQVADGPLLNTESYAIGGYDSVRGYLESEALADDAGRASLEFSSLNLARLVADEDSLFNEFRLIAFFDGVVGRVQDPTSGQRSHYDLGSVGVGARITLAKHLFGAFDLAQALSDGVQTKEGEWRSLFRVWTAFP